MRKHDALLYMLALVSPYAYMLSLRAPYSLRIEPAEDDGFAAAVCCLAWPMVIGSGILLCAAAVAFKHGHIPIAIGLALCAAPLFILLLVPGLIAFRRHYGLEREDRP